MCSQNPPEQAVLTMPALALYLYPSPFQARKINRFVASEIGGHLSGCFVALKQQLLGAR
jgi:hypothetical protein